MTVVALILPGIAALVLLGAYFCYRLAFYVPREDTIDPYDKPVGEQYEPLMEKIMDCIRKADALPFRWVHTASHDGLLLVAKFYEAAPELPADTPIQIMFHGYRGNPLRDFSGGLPLALKCGCNALAVDQRAHGASEGRCLSFGVQERLDCLAWARYAAERWPDAPIILVGLSMGAATVMMASDLPLPKQVVGIIADCGYSSPKAIICKVMEDIKYPRWLFPLVWLGGRIFGGFDVCSASAEQSLANTDIPVLLLHGEDDRFVPCEMSRRCFAACRSEKKLVTVPDAGHGLAYMVGPDAYRTAVQTFVAERVAAYQK